MATELTPEEFARVDGQSFKNEAELYNALHGNSAEVKREVQESMYGYVIGSVSIPPVTLGLLPMLELIDSPFLKVAPGDTEAALVDVSIGLTDLMKTAYVLCKGTQAVFPLLGLARRLKALESLKPLAANNPDSFSRLMEKTDELSSQWAVFEAAAIEFWGDVGDVDIQEVTNTIASVIQDAVAGWGAIPDKGGAQKKM